MGKQAALLPSFLVVSDKTASSKANSEAASFLQQGLDAKLINILICFTWKHFSINHVFYY